MPLCSSSHVFHPVVDNFYWLSGLDSQERDMRGEHRWVLFLAAKRAARFHLHHTYTVFRQATQFHERLMYIVGALQRTPHGDSLVRIESRDHSIVFDVQLLLRAGGVFRF